MSQQAKKSKRRVWLVSAAVVVALLMLVPLLSALRQWRAPYPAWGKRLSWTMALQEPAYNFGTVVPGKLYRMGRPDARMLAYVREKYGIKRLIGLSGRLPIHDVAERMGMEVKIYSWQAAHLPPQQELAEVVALMQQDKVTAVHCMAGADRTGYAVASYRFFVQHWDYQRAIAEMPRYWHIIPHFPKLHSQLRKYLVRQPASLGVAQQ